MGDALFELEQILRSKQVKFTSQEANVLMMCKSNAIKDFTIGAAGGGGVTWLATRRLNNLFRINLSAEVEDLSAGSHTYQRQIQLEIMMFNKSIRTAVAFGLWRFGRSLDSCIGHILTLEGSRMQKELANISSRTPIDISAYSRSKFSRQGVRLILKRYQNDPRTMQLVSKHFYSEKVFDDSSTDQPKIRWRYRNFFGDNVANSQRTHGSDSCSDKTDSEKTDMENTDEPKCFSRNSSADAITNPLDCVFGIPASTEEIHHTNTSGTSPKRHGRGHKRSHRRHRMHRHEVSPNFQLS
ncbi:unnamed protein product [Camellia sinensis]